MFRPILAVLLAVNICSVVVLVLLGRRGQAAGLAVFMVMLMVLVGLVQAYAFLTMGKIGG